MPDSYDSQDRHRALMFVGSAIVVSGLGEITGYQMATVLLGLPLLLVGLWYTNRTLTL